MFKKTLWTAEGVKLLPADIDMTVKREVKKDIPASPPFLSIVSDSALNHLQLALSEIPHNQYLNSECVRRDVRRIPLKPEGENEEEVKHLSMSSDGVRFFHPVTRMSIIVNLLQVCLLLSRNSINFIISQMRRRTLTQS